MQKVKMLEIQIPSRYASEIKHEKLYQFYTENSKIIKDKWSYEHYKHSDFDGSKEEWIKLVEDQFETVLEKYPKFASADVLIQASEYVNLIDAFINAQYGESPTVRKSFEVSVTPDASSIVGLMQLHTDLMQKQMEQLTNLTMQHFNDKCNVSISDNFLSSVNQTLLLEDSCTDTLQHYLHDGWRILTICPQPNQRRPDYILGKIEENTIDHAKRS